MKIRAGSNKDVRLLVDIHIVVLVFCILCQHPLHT